MKQPKIPSPSKRRTKAPDQDAMLFELVELFKGLSAPELEELVEYTEKHSSEPKKLMRRLETVLKKNIRERHRIQERTAKTNHTIS